MKLADFLKTIRPRKTRNRKLLLATAKRLRALKHEEHYNQGIWATETSCGTAGCIAYHVVMSAGCPSHGALNLPFGVKKTARVLLGLAPAEIETLFSDDGRNWPSAFGKRFDDTVCGRSIERPSRVAADLLEALAKGRVKL